MHIDFPKAIHVHEFNNIQKEAAWMTKISKAVSTALAQDRTHVLLIFTTRECKNPNNGYLFDRFLQMQDAFANLGYNTSIQKIDQGYSFLLSWTHHGRTAE